MTPILVSTEIAAEALSISTVTLRRLTRAKKIRCTRIGRRTLYSPSDLNRFVSKVRKAS